MAYIDVYAQSTHETVVLAESAFEHGYYAQAAALYDRVLFFDDEGSFDTLTLPRISACYFALADWEKSAEYYQMSYQNFHKSSYVFYQVSSLIASHNYLEAKKALYSLGSNQGKEIVIQQILSGLIDLKLNNFDSAKKSFLKADSLLSLTDQGFYERTEVKYKKLKRKSSIKAMVLSGILPGLGHAYSGHFSEGVNSVSLVGVVGIVYFIMAKRYGLVDALVGIMPWYYRYYTGGINRAGELVRVKQDEIWADIYGDFLSRYQSYID